MRTLLLIEKPSVVLFCSSAVTITIRAWQRRMAAITLVGTGMEAGSSSTAGFVGVGGSTGSRPGVPGGGHFPYLQHCSTYRFDGGGMPAYDAAQPGRRGRADYVAMTPPTDEAIAGGCH